MNKENYRVIGVMSGTSLDGIDLAVCNFELCHHSEKEGREWKYKMDQAITVPYPSSWKKKLQEAIRFPKEKLDVLNLEYTQYLGGVISNFIEKYKIKKIDAICSHGHTVLHQPKDNVTLQIGNLPMISEIIGEKVVCDFRVQDVQLGGQGAPLVPIGDQLLFSDYKYCLNLGGFANISSEIKKERIAYDICPVNIVLNHYALQMGVPYDDKGKIASSGKIHDTILSKLNNLAYYKQAPPKSLGLEWVQQCIFPLLESHPISTQDKIATFTEHIVFQLAKAIKEDSTVLVSGGGAYNIYVLERIKQYGSFNLVVPDTQLLEYKEALVFGLLGVLKIRGEINCLASVTGATKNHSSGKIFE